METIGIIAPTSIEAEELISNLSGAQRFRFQGKSFNAGRLGSKSVVLAVSGIGKANAAHAAALLFEKYRPSHVYVTGVAGAYPSSDLDIGDIAIADREIYGDEGLMTSEGLITFKELGLKSEADSHISNEFPLLAPANLTGRARIGTFVTVSSCTGSFETGMKISQRFKAICENMEGAAVAHVCLLNGATMTEIRAVSNVIGDRSKAPIDKDALCKAAFNAQNFLIELIHQTFI